MANYSKQILSMLHMQNHIKTINTARSISLDGFEEIDMTKNNNSLIINPGAYFININGKKYAFVLFERLRGPITLIGTSAAKIENTHVILYEFKSFGEDGVIKNTVNSSADYVIISGSSTFKTITQNTNIQTPYSDTVVSSIDVLEYILSGKNTDQYVKYNIQFYKHLKSLNDKDLFLINNNTRKSMLIGKVGAHYATGNEDWKLYKRDQDSYIFSLDRGFYNMDLTSPYLKCNYFPSKEFNEMDNCDYCICISNGVVYIKVPRALIGNDNSFPQLKFKEYLNKKYFDKNDYYNPVTILYKLKNYTFVSNAVTNEYDFKTFYNLTKFDCNHMNNVTILCKNLKEV